MRQRSLVSLTGRLRMLAPYAGRIRYDWWALLPIAAAVVLANLLYLLGIFDPNPLGPQSGLYDSIRDGFLAGTNTIDPNIGYTSQALGHRAAIDLLHLQLPWWNPYEAAGAPLAAGMQSAALFPATLLLVFANGQIYEHVLLELVAGFATFALLRRVGLGSSVSSAGAIAFALNGTFAWLGNAAFNPVAFLPLLLLGIEHAYASASAGRPGGWRLVAVAVALSVYAGFPEVAYVDGLMAVVWFGWRLGCARPDRRRGLIGKAAAGVIVGVLLATPILVPFLGYLPHALLGANGGGERGQLPVQALPQLLLPYVYGPIFQFADPGGVASNIWGDVGGYLTMSLVLFALVGLAFGEWRRLRLALGGWLLLALAKMYGEPPLLGHVLGFLPGMSSVEFRRFGAPAVELTVVVLACLGLHELGQNLASRRRAVSIGLVGLAIAGIAILGARPLVDRLSGSGSQYHFFALAGVGAAGVIGIGTIAMFLRDRRTGTYLACALVAAEAMAMFIIPELSAPRSVRTDVAPATYLKEHLGLGRFVTLGPFQPDYGSYFGVASINENNIPTPTAFATYVNAQLDPAVSPYVFVGTGNGGRPTSAPSPQQELIAHLSGYRAAGVKYVVTEPAVALPRKFRLVFRSGAAWIYQIPAAAPYFTASAQGCAIAPIDRTSVRLRCPSRTVLVRRETYLPGWSAQVDGRAVQVREASGVFESVDVGAGSHLISFRYAPPGLSWALAAFALGAAWLLLGLRRSRPRVHFRQVAAPRALAHFGFVHGETEQSRTSRRVAEGLVESVDERGITGWAWCPAAPTLRIGVRAILDGDDTDRTIAELPRPSLAQAGIGDGRHGFRLSVPVRPDAQHHLLRVETDSGVVLPPAAGFTALLAGAELTLDSSPRTPEAVQAVGYIEEVTVGYVSGWTWNPATPHLRLSVWAVVDGGEIAAAIADLPRPSLIYAGIGDGRYGFRIELPVQASGPLELRVETDTGVALPPSPSVTWAKDAHAAYRVTTPPS